MSDIVLIVGCLLAGVGAVVIGYAGLSWIAAWLGHRDMEREASERRRAFNRWSKEDKP